MPSFDHFTSTFNDSVNSVMMPVLGNKYVSAFAMILVVLYGGLVAPKIPTSLAPLFSSPIFKIVFMALIAWLADHDPVSSLLVAVVYFFTMTYLSKNVFVEAFSFSTVTDNLKSLLGFKNVKAKTQ